jgi:hypothetical protein
MTSFWSWNYSCGIINTVYFYTCLFALLCYVDVTARELVQYIIHTYSRIDPTQLADCYTKMTRPYDLQDLIETLFTQIDDGVRYAPTGGAALRRGPVCQHCVFADPGQPESPVGMC